MTKLKQILTPLFAITLGALILLTYMNSLNGQGSVLAIGIIGVIFSVYYLAYGIITLVVPDKLSAGLKKGLHITAIVLYPLFMFAIILTNVIEWNAAFGPSGWTIAIISLTVTILFALLYILNALTENDLLKRLALLFGGCVILVIVLSLIFDFTGAPTQIGNVTFLEIGMYVLYGALLIDVLAPLAAKKENAPVGEKKEEEAPEIEHKDEGAPQEEEKSEPADIFGEGE